MYILILKAIYIHNICIYIYRCMCVYIYILIRQSQSVQRNCQSKEIPHYSHEFAAETHNYCSLIAYYLVGPTILSPTACPIGPAVGPFLAATQGASAWPERE